MKKTQEQQYLQVKQQLDYYRLPTTFPFECLDLLSQLLTLLSHHTKPHKQNPSPHSHPLPPELDNALRLQMGKITKQNNKLHMDLLSAKEQILALKYHNDKFMVERSGGSKEVVELIQAQREREDQLVRELGEVKFKFNQLMDLVYEDAGIEKRYLKRLRKYKKYQEQQRKPYINEKQFKKGPHQTVTDLESKLTLLQTKIAHRQNQILRLQKKTQFDGLNMNRILKDFQNKQTNTKVGDLQHRIDYLEQENKKMKEEVAYGRRNGGSREALREEMRRGKERVGELERVVKELRRQLKHKQHDVQAKLKQEKRQSQKVKQLNKKQANELELSKLIIQDLKKKVQFFQGQVNACKASLEKQQKQNIEKQSTIDNLKNTQQGYKLLSQYEIQSLKQRIQQLETQIQQLTEKVNIFKAQNDYHKKQDKLKNQAIQNLQKIVDQLMKPPNPQAPQHPNLPTNTNLSLQNIISLKRNLMQYKQSLSVAQNQKLKLKKEVELLRSRNQQKVEECNVLNQEVRLLRVRVEEMRYGEREGEGIRRELDGVQAELKRQQNMRIKLQQISQQQQATITKHRKQLQQLTQQYELYQKKSKSNTNTLKLQLDQANQNARLLQLTLQQKQKKITQYAQKIEQLNGRIKLLKDQVRELEEERSVAVRDRHKFEKRCEEMLKVKEEKERNQAEEEDRELHQRVIQYQREIQKLREKISAQAEQITQLNSYCQAMKISEQNLSKEKSMLKRQYEKMKISRDVNNQVQQEQEEQEQEEC